MARIETIMVEAETEAGYMIINAEDFDAEKHKEFKAPAAPSKPSESESEGEGKGKGEKPVTGEGAKPTDPKKAEK